MTLKEACLVATKVLAVCGIVLVWLTIKHEIHGLQDRVDKLEKQPTEMSRLKKQDKNVKDVLGDIETFLGDDLGSNDES